MTPHSTQFQATEGGLILTSAILLYQAESTSSYGLRAEGGAAFASLHEVEHHDSQPVIAAGTPLTRAHLRQWSEALERNIAPELLPDNVLVAHPDMLAWWVPAKIRRTYFALSRPPAGLKVIGEKTALPLPYPAHLFIATRRGLWVYALRESQRPNAATPVLHSPVLNVFINGSLCWGNIAQPKTLTIAAMPDYEQAVFDSWSTHPNPGQESTVTGKGGLVRLWDDLAARGAKRFPVERLRPFESSKGGSTAEPVTLGMIVGGAAR